MFKSKLSRAEKAAAKLQQQQQQSVDKQDYFENCHRTYSCTHCRAHLASHDELISKLFQGNHGRAYLFNKVVNVGCKQAVERELLTGLHAVADIYCDSCETTLGWKYEQAFEPSQKYKEGKYIIELVHMLKENSWDLNSYNLEEFLKQETQPLNSPSSSILLADKYRTSASWWCSNFLATPAAGSSGSAAAAARQNHSSNWCTREKTTDVTDNISNNNNNHASGGKSRHHAAAAAAAAAASLPTCNSQTTSGSTSVSIDRNSVNNNPCKRDDNKSSRQASSGNESQDVGRATDNCHRHEAKDSHNVPPTATTTTTTTIRDADPQPLQSSSIFPPPQHNSNNNNNNNRADSSAAQVELANGIELIERSLNQLRLDIQHGSSYFGAQVGSNSNNNINNNTDLDTLDVVRGVAHSLCSSRTASDVCSSTSGTDISASADC